MHLNKGENRITFLAHMVLGVILFATAVWAFTALGGKFIQSRNLGDFGATQAVGCIKLDAVKSDLSPADLVLSMQDCMQVGKVYDAADLLLIASARAIFDRYRVSGNPFDQNAKLWPQFLSNPVTAKRYGRVIWDAYQTKEGWSVSRSAKFCAQVLALDTPNNELNYLLIPELNKGLGRNVVPVITGTNAIALWQNTVKNFLKCPT